MPARLIVRKTASRLGWHRSGWRFGSIEPLELRQLLAFDPSASEQAMLEDINRMRMDPEGELSVLFRQLNPLLATDEDVQGALSFFRVDAAALLEQWSELEPVAPVAWNEQLYEAALNHNLKMIEFDEQSHQLPDEPDVGERIRDTGYNLTMALENVYAFGESTFQSHAGFVIDWGDGPTGIQDPPGHRNNMMNPLVHEVGVSIVAETNQKTDVGPLVISQEFARQRIYIPQVLGVVYTDRNDNGQYDAGEGLKGVDVDVTGAHGTFTTTTMSAGGYQLPVPNGEHSLVASGGGLSGSRIVTNIVVSGQNVKVDVESQTAWQPPVAVNDTHTTSEDVAVTIDLLANDGDVDGALNPESVQITLPPRHGQLSADVRDGSVRYVPDSNYFGTDSFRYRVFDDDGAPSNEAFVNITVGSTNDAPVVADDAFTVDEDALSRLNVLRNDGDVDGTIDRNSLRIVRRPTHGAIELIGSTGELTYQPQAEFTGADWFTYTVRDNDGLVSRTARVDITVRAVNDAPLALSDQSVTFQDYPLDINVIANDIDPDGSIDVHSVGITRFPRHGEVVVNPLDGVVTYSPDTGFFGRDTFAYALLDNQGALSGQAEVILIVTEAGVPWRNPANPYDVDNDGAVAPLDALVIVNDIVKNRPRPLPMPSSPSLAAPPFFDTNGDGLISPLDALLVINRLSFRRPATTVPTQSAVAPRPREVVVSTEPRAALAAEVVIDADLVIGEDVGASGQDVGTSAAGAAQAVSRIKGRAVLVSGRQCARSADCDLGPIHTRRIREDVADTIFAELCWP